MIETKQTPTFKVWFAKLRDDRAKRAFTNRIGRIGYGLFGDSKPVGEGVSELRIDVGPGYRVYFARIGGAVVLLLCGGDKSSQAKDIAQAKTLAAQAKDDGK